MSGWRRHGRPPRSNAGFTRKPFSSRRSPAAGPEAHPAGRSTREQRTGLGTHGREGAPEAAGLSCEPHGEAAWAWGAGRAGGRLPEAGRPLRWGELTPRSLSFASTEEFPTGEDICAWFPLIGALKSVACLCWCSVPSAPKEPLGPGASLGGTFWDPSPPKPLAGPGCCPQGAWGGRVCFSPPSLPAGQQEAKQESGSEIGVWGGPEQT